MLDHLEGYIAKGPLVEIADGAFRHKIDYENQALCSKITLADIFPDVAEPVFANWFSGEINASLSDEIMRNGEGEEVTVERTLKLDFRNGVLTSEDVALKFPLTRGEIENGLTSPDASVRREFAESREYRLTPEQIERGLQDEDSAVRVSFMYRTRRTLTPEQQERAMTDECAEVRRYATLFENCKPTPFQLEHALKDANPDIRCNMANRFSDQLTPEQMERGLTDENGEVRAAFASVCYQPTPEQFERGLTDEYEKVRYWFVCNEDIELSPAQIQRCLNDEHELIPLEIASRYNCDLIKVPTLDPMFDKFYQVSGTKVLDLLGRDDEQAVSFFRKAAEQGDAVGQRRLGWSYYNGRGVPQDYEEAEKWFRLSAEQGDAKAQFNLGLMYKNGSRIIQDNEAAARWYRLAADQGDIDAQIALTSLGANRSVKMKPNMPPKITAFVEQVEDMYAIARNPSHISIQTGFPELDKELKGIQSGSITLISSERLHGKTSLALSIALHAALQQNIPTIIIDSQRKVAGITMRLISQLSEISIQALKSGRLVDDDWGKLTHAIGLLNDAPIFIKDDGPGFLENLVPRLLNEHPAAFGLVVIDGLDFEEPSQAEAQRKLTTCMMELCKLVGLHNIHVIATTQLNHALHHNENRIPSLRDIPFDIADMADVVLIPYCPDRSSFEESKTVVSGVAVHKHGAENPVFVPLVFMADIGRFGNKRPVVAKKKRASTKRVAPKRNKNNQENLFSIEGDARLDEKEIGQKNGFAK